MTIDRAIEILNPDHREHYDGLEEVNEACRMGVEALERQQWIPCSERLPEKEGWYLVTYYSLALKRKHITMKPFCEGTFQSFCEVTHWLPLPEPPEEGGNENAN